MLLGEFRPRRHDRLQPRPAATIECHRRISGIFQRGSVAGEQPRRELCREMGPRRVAGGMRPKGAVLPLAGMPAQSGTHGVHTDVDADRARGRPVGNLRGVEATPDQMVDAAVALVVAERVPVVDEPHELRDVRHVRLEEEVDVVAHLHVLVALDAIGGDAFVEQPVVPLAILGVLEHRSPVVSATGDVVQSTIGLAAWSSWHANAPLESHCCTDPVSPRVTERARNALKPSRSAPDRVADRQRRGHVSVSVPGTDTTRRGPGVVWCQARIRQAGGSVSFRCLAPIRRGAGFVSFRCLARKRRQPDLAHA